MSVITAATKSDMGVKEDIAAMGAELAIVKVRLGMVEKLQWVVLVVVVGSLLKSFVGG